MPMRWIKPAGGNMGEYDFLGKAPGKRTVQAPGKQGAATGRKPAGNARNAVLDDAEGYQVTAGKGKTVVYAKSAGELSALAVSRELERLGQTMELTKTQQAELEDMQERSAGREAATTAAGVYQDKIKALQALIGDAYKYDLIMQPPMWAAQGLQPGYGERQARTASEIAAVDLPRIVRVLDACGLTITRAAKPKAALAAEKDAE